MITKEILKQWMLEDNGSILPDPLHPGIFSGYIRFDKERARLALGCNIHNRELGKKRQIPQLKEEMIAGKWNDNIDRISFDEDCILSNGQNRLYASIEANVPIRCLVTFGVEKSAQRSTDRRGSRTLSDDFKIDGFKDSKTLSVMTRTMYLLNNDATVRSILNSGEKLSSLSDSILYDYFINNKELIVNKNKIVSRSRDSIKHLKINAQVHRVLAIIFDDISPDDAEFFWKKLGIGFGNNEEDPIHLLYLKLQKNANTEQGKMPSVVMAALIIKAWNLYERGETTKLLKFTVGGKTPEDFPKIWNPYSEKEIE